MSEHDSDREFEEYLERRASGRGRLALHDDLEPPHELDRIVLAKAREAIEMPRQVPVYAGARWALPVALAATLVLSFAILLHFGRAQRPVPVATAPSTPTPTEAQIAKPEADSESGKALSSEELAPRAAARLEKRERVEAQPAREAADVSNGIASVSQMRPAPAAAIAAKADPEEWLKRIEALRAAGKTAEADRELEEFRKAWPDYPLPAASSR